MVEGWNSGSEGHVESVEGKTVTVYIDKWAEKKKNGKPYQNPNRLIVFEESEIMKAIDMGNKKEKQTKVYLTPMGMIIAMGELTLRAKQQHKSIQQVLAELNDKGESPNATE